MNWIWRPGPAQLYPKRYLSRLATKPNRRFDPRLTTYAWVVYFRHSMSVFLQRCLRTESLPR